MADKYEQSIFILEEEAARLLSVSPETLRRWRREGRGPRPVKIGRLIRYRPADLREFADRLAGGPKKEEKTDD